MSDNSLDLNALLPDLPSPQSKHSFWRSCNFKPLLNHAWQMTEKSNDEINYELLVHLDGLIFINGQYQEKLSKTYEHVEIKMIHKNSDDVTEDVSEYFYAMHHQVSDNQYEICLKESANEESINIWQIQTASFETVSSVYLQIKAEARTKNTIVWRYKNIGSNATWLNETIDMDCQEYAALTLYQFYDYKDNLLLTHSSKVNLAEKAVLKQFNANKHVIFLYHQQDVFLESKSAEWKLNGFYILHEKQNAQYRLKAHHVGKDGKSKQFMRGLLSDTSSALFDSTVIVAKGASGSESSQMNNNLLLSKKVKIQSLPILEIDEDDVACSHGATIGAFDEAMLFYLQSRGLSTHMSFSLMKRAFISEIIQDFMDSEPSKYLDQYLQHKD